MHSTQAATHFSELPEGLQSRADLGTPILLQSNSDSSCESPHRAGIPTLPDSHSSPGQQHLNRTWHPPATPSEAATSMAEVGSWGVHTCSQGRQNPCPWWAAALCMLVGCAFQCWHLFGLQLSCAGTRQPQLCYCDALNDRFSTKEGNTLPVLMGTCKKWMWVTGAERENKKFQKALEHLWFELALQRKSCSPEDREMWERGACLSLLALPGQEYSMWWRSRRLVMMGTTRNSSYDKRKV